MEQSQATAGGTPDRSQASILMAIRLLAAVALAVSGYLVFQSTIGRGPAGCGPGSDCEEVLASRWSSWMGVPVSVPAVGVYLAILIASASAGARTRPVARRRLAWVILTPLAIIAAGAGGWFVALQALAVGRFCPYCTIVHACGILIGGLAIAGLAALSARGRDENYRVIAGARPGKVWALLLVSAVGLGVLIAGQWFGTPPAPRSGITVVGGGGEAIRPSTIASVSRPATGYATGSTTRSATAPIAVREVTRFPMGAERVALDPRDWPVLGSPDAPAVVAVMADYTCPHCRIFHGLLDKALARYPGQLAVIVLPVPMNSDCNPRIKQTLPLHANGCALARIALAVWRANPGAFERMDRWLFETTTRARTPGEAREYAIGLIGEEALRRGEADPAVEDRIRQSVGFYDKLGGGEIPKLIPPKPMANFRLQGEADLFKWLEAEMGVKPR